MDAFLDGKRNPKNDSYCAPAGQVFDDFCGPSPLGLVAEITVGELQKCVISQEKQFVIIILAWETGGSSREPLRMVWRIENLKIYKFRAISWIWLDFEGFQGIWMDFEGI